MASRWSTLVDRVDSADPGGLRRSHAARAALAALSVWLFMRVINGLFADGRMPSASLYAVTVCFIGSLVIVDPSRNERRLTLGLSACVFCLAVLMAGAIGNIEWLYLSVLLALMFLSYFTRRFGLRAGELMLLLTMGLYFGVNSGVTWANAAWFLIAAMAGVASLWLWQFILLPYDPAQSLHDCVRAFYRRTAGVVEIIGEGVENSAALPAQNDWAKELDERLKRVKLSRRAIEGQFPGVLAPTGWTPNRISQLQIALYSAEQGLTQMIEGACNPESIVCIPTDFRVILNPVLRALQETLLNGSAESMQALANEGAATRTRVQEYAHAAFGDEQQDATRSLPAWGIASLRMLSGGVQLAKSAGRVKGLVAQPETHNDPKESSVSHTSQSRETSRPPLVRVLGGLNLHPTTVLGLQAVLATGLALAVARSLGVDHANWVFWTAFVVIAGSAGDSLRRIILRVVGTIAGALIGVSLALLAPDNTVLIVVVAATCIFLAIYFSSVSYPLLVFWVNIGFVMVYTLLGANEFDLLVDRPLTTFLGALIAAVVVVFVFPIRITDRFKVAAARFLEAVDGYVAAFVDAMTTAAEETSVTTARARAASAYALIEQTLPGVAFENSPLLQADNAIAGRATQLAALDADLSKLAQAESERAGIVKGDESALMHVLRDRVHHDIQQVVSSLHSGLDKGKPASEKGREQIASSAAFASWALEQGRDNDEVQPNGNTHPRTAGTMALIRIQRTVSRLASDSGKFEVPNLSA